MAQASYSFLDVAALDEVRGRFAAGDALVILSNDLAEIIWANGPGAALFGHADVETALGAEAPLGAAAKRQIAATSGFPDIGRDRALLVRVARGVSSRALEFLASAVMLPDGEEAILLAQPAAIAGAGEEDAGRAIGGFGAAGHFLAFVDAEGAIEAAGPGFARLGLAQEALAAMAREADERRPIVKRMLQGRRGVLPVGLARLTDKRNLLVAIDENFAAEPEDVAETSPEVATETAPAGQQPAREIWYLGSTDGSEDQAADEPETMVETPVEIEPPAAARAAFANAAAADTITESEATEARTAELETTGRVAGEQEPATGQPTSSGSAPVQRPTGLVRFVWRTDADGKFSQISPEFALAVGELAADIVGRRFQDVANTFGLDPTGEIAGLLARRDTWSGRSVGWPVAGTDRKIPVDLAALPVYDRNRNFEGFRGFGVARTGDAVADPEGIGLVLVRLPEVAIEPEEPQAEPDRATESAAAEGPKADPAEAKPEEEPAAETPADPFQGEKPALTVTSAPDRRFSDKIIRLAEHRQPANDRGPNGNGAERSLSTGERIAFQQIGERLKKESGATTPEAKGSEPEPASAGAEKERDKAEAADPAAEAGQTEPAATDPVEWPDETVVEAEDIAALQALDGVTDETAGGVAAEVPEPAAAEKAQGPEAAGPASEPEAGAGKQRVTEPPQEPTEPSPRPRKVRPGMSLLDFAEWGRDDAAEEGALKSVALVEMEEAAALAESRPALPASDEAAAAEEEIEPTIAAETVEGTPAEADVEVPGVESAGVEPQQTEPVETEAGQAEEIEAAAEETRTAEVSVPAGAEAAGETAASPAEQKAGLSILEKLPVPVLVHSGDSLHYANDEFFALTGYRSIEELAQAGGIGGLFADPYEDDAEDEPRRKTDRRMRLKTREGLEFPVEAFLQSVPWENGKALVLVLSRAKEGAFGSGQSPLIAELEARVAEMRTIIDTATDGVVLIARDGTIRSISRPAEALFGLDSDDVAGKPFFSLFAIESQKSARDYLNGLTDHGVASILNDGREVIGREAQGRFIPLFMTIGKLPSDSGYCAVVRDITQWKRAEEELTQARATAERASSHKTEFLARVSHEIRTPLNAIIGFSELMLDEKFGPVANDRYRDYLRDINRSGNHVLDLVNDLLDISKIEAGQQEMAYEAVSLNETLSETVALMQPQANRERVIIRSSFASRLPDVVADLRSVRQIALNILSNAVRYTQAGGQVIVSTAYEAQGEVVLRVRDTGIGMTPAEIDQALKPFKQINSLKRTRGDGTGLGLPLTKAMVEANRAKFSIHSTPGEGTLVEVAFPSTRVLAD